MAARRAILVVEDERDTRELVRFHLEQEGFAVLEAESGDDALTDVAEERPALVVLDLTLPGTGGLEVCRRLRAADATRTIPIVMLTARAAEADRVLGLELGADDYVTKPFSPRELVARVRAVLRRTHREEPSPKEVYAHGRLQVDFNTRDVFLGGAPVRLSLREFELLAFFVRHPHWVYERQQLLDLVWGKDTHVHPRTVDAHILRLRKCLERPQGREVIVTVRGVGYKFNPAALEA